MITIRDELIDNEIVDMDYVLDFLGIDPDLPAEWATERRCLEWLDRHGVDLGGIEAEPRINARQRYSCTFFGPEDSDEFVGDGDTLHAALVAVCKAVVDAVE